MRDEDGYPPITQLCMLSLALIVAGGIDLAAHLPKHVPLGPPIVLLILSALLLSFNIASLTRVRGFAWERFFAVARWAALA
jgi:hypothetical protein